MRIAFLFVAVASVITLPGQCQADDERPDLDEIIRRLTEWRGSFSRLRMVYEQRNPGQLQKHQPELVQTGNPSDFFRRFELIITNTEWRRHESWEYMGRGGTLSSHNLWGVNDRQRFAASYGTVESTGGAPAELTLGHVFQSVAHSPAQVMPLTHLCISTHENDWLANLLQRSRPQIAEYGKVDGCRCAALTWPPDSNVKLWLDLDHDCLPRLREQTNADPDKPDRFHVEEFLRLSNGRWFPARGTDSSGTLPTDETHHWVVTDVAVNEDIPLSRFSPPEPGPDTWVTDWIRYGGQMIRPHSQVGKPRSWLARLATSRFAHLRTLFIVAFILILAAAAWHYRKRQ